MESILKTVRWKVTICPTGDDCWCRMIEPVEPITDEKGNEWDNVVGAAQIGKDLAEHIVGLHNNYMDNLTPSPHTVYSDEEKERLNNLLTKKMEKHKALKDNFGVDVELWERVSKMNDNTEPCCDENNPCTCNTFSPNMPKPGDWEREREMIKSKWPGITNSETRASMLRAAAEKLGIPKKYFGRK
jgi:hypothetical protein